MNVNRTVFISACVALALIAIAMVATAQTITSVSPDTAVRGTSITIDVHGSDFAYGAKVLVYGGGTAIWASSVSFVNVGLLKASLTIPANAYLGSYAVYVQNPGAYSWIYRANCITVGTSAPAPILITPANGTVFLMNLGNPVTLAWKPVPGATGYDLETAWFRDTDQVWVSGAVIVIDGGASSAYQITASSAGDWRWRVIPRGVASPQPSVYRYYTFGRPKLATPTLLTPEDNVVLYHSPRSLTCTWNPVGGAGGYYITFQKFEGGQWVNSYGTGILAGVEGGDCSLTVDWWEIGITYRWRVEALRQGGSGYLMSDPSEWHTFTFSAP